MFSNLINFILSLAVFFVLLLLFRVPLSWWVLSLPIIIAVQFVLVVGLALIVAALNVFYRDVEHVLGRGTPGVVLLDADLLGTGTAAQQAPAALG